MEHTSEILSDYWKKLCTKTNFLSVSRKHLFCYIPGNLGAILRFQYSFDYRKRNNARHTLYIAHLKLLETVSAPIYYQHLIFHLKKTFPHLLRLGHVLHTMIVISMSNYPSLLSSPCGFRSVKQQPVSSYSVEKI